MFLQLRHSQGGLSGGWRALSRGPENEPAPGSTARVQGQKGARAPGTRRGCQVAGAARGAEGAGEGGPLPPGACLPAEDAGLAGTRGQEGPRRRPGGRQEGTRPSPDADPGRQGPGVAAPGSVPSLALPGESSGSHGACSPRWSHLHAPPLAFSATGFGRSHGQPPPGPPLTRA